jgi:crotonobetainyl-CoA:carnitine CoA-transferase CaiB-like acyl-CoA transferase
VDFTGNPDHRPLRGAVREACAPFPDPKLRARARVIAEWFTAHQDRDALKRDLETARLAWAEIRHAGDVLAAPAVAGRGRP